MLGQESVTEMSDRQPGLFVAAGFDCEVALRVEAHGPVAEIRRPNPGYVIIDDQHL
jgi:hypothetical protein